MNALKGTLTSWVIIYLFIYHAVWFIYRFRWRQVGVMGFLLWDSDLLRI